MVTLRYSLLVVVIAPKPEVSATVRVVRWFALVGSASTLLLLKYWGAE